MNLSSLFKACDNNNQCRSSMQKEPNKKDAVFKLKDMLDVEEDTTSNTTTTQSNNVKNKKNIGSKNKSSFNKGKSFVKKIASAVSENDVEEVAPPGANYERMVKHLKDKFGDDSPVPYQIAWTKYKNRGKK